MPELVNVIKTTVIETVPNFIQDRVANALLRNQEEQLLLDENSEDVETSFLARWYRNNRKPGGLYSNRGKMRTHERIFYLLKADHKQRKDWIDFFTKFGDTANYQATLDPNGLSQAVENKNIDGYIYDLQDFDHYRELIFQRYLLATQGVTQSWQEDKAMVKQLELIQKISNFRSTYHHDKEALRLKIKKHIS